MKAISPAKLSDRTPVGVDSEWTQVESQSQTISVGEGKIRSRTFSVGCEMSVRVLENGGQGILTTTNLDGQSHEELFKRALEMARMAPKDPHRRLQEPAGVYPISPDIEPDLFRRSSAEWVEILQALEQEILSSDQRIQKVVRLELRQSLQNSRLSNSKHLELESANSSTSFLVEMVAESNSQIEVGWDARSHRFSQDLNIRQISLDAARQTVNSLGGKPIPSGNYVTLVHPRVGAQLLNLLSDALSAEVVQLGRSFFKDRLDQLVSSPLVTLVDDPLIPRGLASTACDDEGSPSEKVTLIEGGVLKNFLYDIRSAGKEGRKTNGHGMKPSLGSPPHPHPTNFYLSPGSKTVDEMLAAQPAVFYLWDVMGLHMADLITGEFSLGASGYLYENGHLKHPVRGVTISGRLLDLLKNIQEIGSDLTWMGDRGAPPFLVSQLTVAGT